MKTQTRRTTIMTVTRILFVPGNVFFGLSGVFFSFVSRAFLVFAFIFTHCFGAGGILWLVCAGWGALGLWAGFSFVSQVFFSLFCSCFYLFAGFSGICFCAGLRLL